MPYVYSLGRLCKCATWLCFTAGLCAYGQRSHARRRDVVSLLNISIKGPKDREMPGEQTVHIVWEAREFHCQDTVRPAQNVCGWRSSPGPGSGTLFSTPESCQSRRQCVPSAWMKTVRPSLGKHWTLARGLTASLQRKVIVTTKAAKASNHPKSRGRRQKVCFHFRWRHALCLLKVQTCFLDLNQMLQVSWTTSDLDYLSLLSPYPGSANWQLVAMSVFRRHLWQSLVQ